MYSNEKKSGFSILDILVKIIFAGLFIFILVWLFQKKVPNMTPFYSNVFRENIKYMQEAGESYFTDDKMPTKIGEEVKISLSDMYEKKLILPFVDEDGNSCNQYNSYVSVTKNESGYSLKTNLVCNNESDYTIKILGCHNTCPTGNCGKTCSIEKITKYQFKKLVSGSKTKYSCPSGYKLSGKYCYKTTLKDTKSAEVKVTTNDVDVQNAKLVVDAGSKVMLTTTVTSTKEYLKVNVITTPGTTTTRQEAYSCQKTKTERRCTTTNVTEGYSCNCTSTVGSTGKTVTVCSTCYRSVPVETCNNVKVPYTDTCYRDVPVTTPGTTTYSCPTTADGSEGSGSSLKCYKLVKSYSCPEGTTNTEGSGSNLKCYKITNGSSHYECEDKTYKVSGSTCVKDITSTDTKYSCDNFKGYKLEGKSCNLYNTKKVKATAKKTSTKYYTYKWSTKNTLSGWTSTGKTKTINGEEVCE